MELSHQNLPRDLEAKIEKIMKREKKSWRDTVLFLLSEGVNTSPKKTRG